MKNVPDLEQLVQKLDHAKREYYRLQLDEESDAELRPPAQAQQIAKLEKILGKPLPPSYRAFLELHNGWTNFDGGAGILSVEDYESKWVQEKVRYWSDLFDEEADNPFANGAIPILLGENENNVLVLDPNTRKQNGEMDFVMYDYTEPEESFKDFTTFLGDCLEVTQNLIKVEKEGRSD